MIKLLTVEPQEGTQLLLRFSDGTWGILDFAHYVDASTEMTAPLRDPAYFRKCFVEAGALAWPNGFDLSAESLHRKLEEVGALHEHKTSARANDSPQRIGHTL